MNIKQTWIFHDFMNGSVYHNKVDIYNNIVHEFISYTPTNLKLSELINVFIISLMNQLHELHVKSHLHFQYR